jgi:DNA modification methylase
MGSGTTCVVAKRLKREWIGIEKENNFFNITNRRVNQISEDLAQNSPLFASLLQCEHLHVS